MNLLHLDEEEQAVEEEPKMKNLVLVGIQSVRNLQLNPI
jgi:hypothetical protein